ncbi:MAG: HAMP domain-containing sensor histidine kinase, partial [Elusimicrobiota bacterium]|nr:HAMP domain-containing sensor histidine kinase [Elusimicrobiota bacterium]
KIISGLVHDLRNTMTVILLSTEILSQANKHSKKDIEKISRAAKFAKGMLANAMQIVRNENYEFLVADIKAPVKRAVDILAYQAKEKNIILDSSFEENLPDIKVSKIHIERIILNTVLNAMSLMPDGGVIKIRIYSDKKNLILRVQDEGPGFPEEVLKKGIKAFNTNRKNKGGTGLGLFVCDQIMKKHSGSMSISNAEEKGSILEFRFPIK